jgi:lantibiotic modifying enzyme
LLNERALPDLALRLLERAREAAVEQHELDLLAGSAGAVAGLATFYSLFPHDWLLDFAVELGDELIARAQGSPEAGYSWPAPGNPRQPNLLGFSHGAAGIGYALHELFRAAGLDRHRDAARRAFRYEEKWFQSEQANWPDFRELTKADLRRKMSIPSATLWCHGAPGIALSRIRAAAALADTSYLDHAKMALHTTKAAIEGWLAHRNGSFCLCHGLAGNADILLYAAQHFRAEADPALRAVADRVALAGSELRAQGDGAWPCGTGAGETPSLMLGLAGIGLFYLRRRNADIPSILVLEPERVCKHLRPGAIAEAGQPEDIARDSGEIQEGR